MIEIAYLHKAQEFIRSLDPVLRNKVATMIDMLEELGHNLRPPFSKSLGKGLFELRIVGDDHVRIFYCFSHNKVYLLHGIRKKSMKLPKRDVDLARSIKSALDNL
ncbi:MAG: type II toxin-antitoxin system RelE/ParE family toxin [Patescibacteria group bacterium]